jgi:5-methylcytosine-specific restriction endonuclease McrA
MSVQTVKISEVKSNPNNQRLIKCQTCGVEFTSKKVCKNRIVKYCGKICYAQSLRKPIKEKLPRKSRKGIPLSIEWRLALSEGRKASDKCKGPNLYNWKGGKDTLSHRMTVHANKRRSAQNIEIDKDFLINLLSAQNNECFYCEKKLSDYKAIEHLTPLSRGGDNQKYNLVYSCKSCNSQKRSKTLEEFAIENKRFDWLDKFDVVFPAALYGV